MMRIYLDNAATSWPKPEAVYTAADTWQRTNGAASGRGVTHHANETDRLIASARQGVARLMNVDDPRRIVFTLNGTDSLNLALHGLLRPGDHVVTTVCEHNSVLRPLAWLREHRGVSATYVPCDSLGFVSPAAIEAAITPATKLIALVHASNVTGALQPAEEVGQIASRHGCAFLLDAAQTLGHLPLDVQRLGCDLLAAPGHKGLLGPLGTGVLYLAPGIEERLEPLRQGGTGSRSDNDFQPTELPDRYESGNLNVPGIAGLAAGVNEILQQGLDAIARHQQALTTQLWGQLSEIPGLQLYGPPPDAPRIGVVSFNLAGWDPQELATLLDTQWSIQTRAGLHCAPKMHEALGTLPAGCVRASFGHFSTAEEVASLAAALRELAAG